MTAVLMWMPSRRARIAAGEFSSEAEQGSGAVLMGTDAEGAQPPGELIFADVLAGPASGDQPG
jgi:hypothetical protein